jgi:hypothetical protein
MFQGVHYSSGWTKIYFTNLVTHCDTKGPKGNATTCEIQGITVSLSTGVQCELLLVTLQMTHWQSSSTHICLGTSWSTLLPACERHYCSSCRDGCWKWGNIHHTVHKFLKTEIYKAVIRASCTFTIFH